MKPRFLRQQPLFLLMLPLFFVTEGMNRFQGVIPVWDGFKLLLVYLTSSAILTAFFYLFFRSLLKASLFTVSLMFFHFFFGALQDLLQNLWPGSFLNHFSVLVPLAFMVFVFLFIRIKKWEAGPSKPVLYLNLLLTTIACVSLVRFAIPFFTKQHSRESALREAGMTICNDCPKPDILLVVLDEYAGEKSLSAEFGFNNSPFISELGKRGFVVTNNSRSNYNYTPYSMASLLNMEYLPLNMKTKNPGNLNVAYSHIRDALIPSYLHEQGYIFYNLSVFDFIDHPASGHNGLIPYSTRLISSQTFLSRISDAIEFEKIYGKLQTSKNRREHLYETLTLNQSFTDKLQQLIRETSHTPRFIYTHLMMPHYPYYYDSTGQALPEDSIVKGKETNRNNYISYLVYCNRQVLKLVDTLLAVQGPEPVIILLGDHGFRHFDPPVAEPAYFSNLQAVKMTTDSLQVYNGMSNVNLFRVLLNKLFRQQLPVLKDSTIYLWH